MALRKEMSLVLSGDAKPRLKWTPELHQRFVDAISQLGGPEKATPKALMRVMGIQGLTLYHLKSHLQKYRLGRSQQSQMLTQSEQEDYEEEEKQMSQFNDSKTCDGSQEQISETLKMAQALQMQMDVQRKLREQIEVQKHLQLRIEAQGKYLESVLKKAEQTLSGYSSCSIEVERAKAQLSQLASMVESQCPSSSFSVLTESHEGSMLKRDARNTMILHNQGSLDSSMTSSDSSWKHEDARNEVDVDYNACNDGIDKGKRRSNVVLPLMDMHPLRSEYGDFNAKRSKNLIDLNSKSSNEHDSGLQLIDLNCKGVEFFNGKF